MSPATIKVTQFNLLIGTILIIVKPTLKLEQIKTALEKQERLEAEGERKRIGEILIEMQAITDENLDLALRFQKFIKSKINIKAHLIDIHADINYSL